MTSILGIGRALAGGVLSVLTTAYGLRWIAAIGLALAIAAFEGAPLSPSVGRLIAASRPEEIRALDKRIANQGAVQLAGFLVLFSPMIPMRFGYCHARGPAPNASTPATTVRGE